MSKHLSKKASIAKFSSQRSTNQEYSPESNFDPYPNSWSDTNIMTVTQGQHQYSLPLPVSGAETQTEIEINPKLQSVRILKSPLCRLNEICAKVKTVPTFELKEQGPPHSPVFTWTARMEAFGYVYHASASGSGTKLLIKHEAARALLRQIDSDSEKEGYLFPSKDDANKASISNNPSCLNEVKLREANGQGITNPVQDLNTLYMKFKWSKPEYELLESETANSCPNTFTVLCKLRTGLLELIESGTSGSKMGAKRVAACKMRQRVLSMVPLGKVHLYAGKDKEDATPKILQQSMQRDGSNNIQLDLSHLVSGSGTTTSSSLGNVLNSSYSNNSANRQLQNPAMNNSLLHQSGTGMSKQSQSNPRQQLQRPPKKVKEPSLKTPLSLLNEICTKANTTPEFTLDEEGPVHSRVYKCTVNVKTMAYSCEASAEGKTKKDAKQDAAKALLLQMDHTIEKFLIAKAPKEEIPPTVIEVDPDVPGNPVGELNDLCTRLKRLPPEYEDVAEVGRPHERVYTVACKLGSQVQESGRGRSKKTAKKVAAYKVHKRVLEMLAKGSEGAAAAALREEDNLMEKLSLLTLISKQDAKKIAEGWKLNDWMSDLRTRTGPKIEKFKDPSLPRSLPGDPVKLLKEICEEQKLKVEFNELQDPRNADKMKSCLVAVSTGNLPLAVLLGTGDSKTQARKVAAEAFIEMLRSVLLSPAQSQ